MYSCIFDNHFGFLLAVPVSGTDKGLLLEKLTGLFVGNIGDLQNHRYYRYLFSNDLGINRLKDAFEVIDKIGLFTGSAYCLLSLIVFWASSHGCSTLDNFIIFKFSFFTYISLLF